ncbi:MAG TPA: hypothetical protein VG033_08080 [Candidatus Acidoferrales bacterium]|jgi:hypothetical protein|nr:hypothetical protein [Candidatus Acidoferrales bacterium]
MKRAIQAAVMVLCMAGVAMAGTPPERWLHVSVIDKDSGETVRVNVPISMAEKVLGTIHQGNLHEGKIKIDGRFDDDVDLRALLDAVRTAPDNEFVSVQGPHEDVSVAKMGGNLVIHVRENGKKGDKKDGEKKDDSRVEVTVPMKLVDALVANGSKDLDVAAALRVLGEMGDMTLVTVQEAEQSVRIWVDSKNKAE